MKAFLPAVAAALLIAAIPAAAQQYRLKPMDFDLWCTEQQHLPYERCAKQLPDDWDKFEKFRAVIEKYEIRDLREKEGVLHLDRSILHHDPIDQKPASEEEPKDGRGN
jgi:hypothetical protein